MLQDGNTAANAAKTEVRKRLLKVTLNLQIQVTEHCVKSTHTEIVFVCCLTVPLVLHMKELEIHAVKHTQAKM